MEILSKNDLMKLYAKNFKEIELEYPISEVLEINGETYLHFDKTTSYEDNKFATNKLFYAGDYALFKRGEGIAFSNKFNGILIMESEMEKYIKETSEVKVIGSKFESFASVFEQGNFWYERLITNERKFESYKDILDNTFKDFEHSKPYMQHALAEKNNRINPSTEQLENITKENYIYKAITTAYSDMLVDGALKERINLLDYNKFKILYMFDRDKNIYSSKSLCHAIVEGYDMLKKFEEKYLDVPPASSQVVDHSSEFEAVLDYAVKVFNIRNEYEKHEENLPILASPNDAEKYEKENFSDNKTDNTDLVKTEEKIVNVNNAEHIANSFSFDDFDEIDDDNFDDVE